jgi:hypothetical protein
MFRAFNTVPRATRKAQRDAIREKFDVDIGDPVREYKNKLLQLKDIYPLWYDCCQSGCVVFTDACATRNACPHCYKDRSDIDGIPYAQIPYLPLIPRLIRQYANALQSEKLQSYRHTFAARQRAMYEDVFSGAWYKECCDVNGLGKFTDRRDVALRMSIDGIGLVENAKSHQQVTPVVLYNCNIHPSERDKAENAIPSIIIPGTANHAYINTFLWPLFNELMQLNQGVHDVHDGHSNESFTLRAHVILVTGDGPAIAQVMGTKTPGAAKRPCRMCGIEGTRAKSKKTNAVEGGNNNSKGKFTYYFPHTR